MKLISSLLDEIISINRLQRKFLESSVSKLSGEDYQLLEAYIRYCADNGIGLSYLSQSYDLITKDTLREQFYFRRRKRYRYSTYAEVASSVYYNDTYMNMYMHGLALTSFFWPNHIKMRRYFEQTIPKQDRGKYIEIGPGHGFYFMKAMRITKFEHFLGVDISPSSVMMTRSILESGHFGAFSNYEIVESDFLLWSTDSKFDAVVMGEVLEHVESPQEFMLKICEITHMASYIYVTTCINAPAIDHIYQFKSFDDLRNMIEKCDLYIKDHLILPYNTLSLEESEKHLLPVNIALVLGKSR